MSTPATSPTAVRLSESRCGDEAACHQRSIEHEGPCVASFGTLAETGAERQQLWRAIAKLGTRRRGWVELGAVSDLHQRDELARRLRRWVREERVDKASVSRWKRVVQQHLDGKSQVRPEGEWRCRVWTFGRSDHAEVRASVIALLGAGPTSDTLAPQVREWEPREAVVQRRITIELAPELSIDGQLEVLSTWCEEQLRGVSWHACIHRERDEGGAWRDTAHVVYTQFALEPERDAVGPTGWWTFERAGRLPPPADVINVLWGKGPEGRRGAPELIKGWRARLTELQQPHIERHTAKAEKLRAASQLSPSINAAARSVRARRRSPEQNRLADLLSFWRELLVEELDGVVVGAIANHILKRRDTRDDGVRSSASEDDPRPEGRAMRAYAWQYRREFEPLVRQIPKVKQQASVEEAIKIERVAGEMEVRGIALQAIIRPEDYAQLMDRLARGRPCVDDARAVLDVIEITCGAEAINRAISLWFSAHRGRLRESVAIREMWSVLNDAAKSKGRRMLQAESWRTGDGIDRTALTNPGRGIGDGVVLMANGTQELGRAAEARNAEHGTSEATGGEGHDGLHQEIRWALARRSSDDGSSSNAFAGPRTDAHAMERIAARAPELATLLRDVFENGTRERALQAAREKAGMTGTTVDARMRLAAQLTPSDAAALVGVDIKGVQRSEDPRVWKELRGRLELFPAVVKRRLARRRKRSAVDNGQWTDTPVADPAELAILEWFAPALAREVREVEQEVSDRCRAFVEKMRTAVQAIRGERDPEKRSILQKTLRDDLAHEQARTALSRVQWMRVAREGGLGPMEIGDFLRIEAARSLGSEAAPGTR